MLLDISPIISQTLVIPYRLLLRYVDVLFVLFLTEEAWSHGSLQARELGRTPLVLVWLTNVSTSPDLYI